MTWSAQVWHVFKKDVRSNWVLGVVVFGIAIALALMSLREYDPNGLPYVFTSAGLPALLTYYTAQSVQFDQPARSDVFWATQPLRPAAVATAKLLHIVFVVCVIAVIVVAACNGWNVSYEKIPALVARKLVALFGVGLVAAHVMTIAIDKSIQGQRNRLRPLLAILIATPLVIFFSAPLQLNRVVNATPTFVYAIAFIGCIALFVRSYQLRERSSEISGASVACCLLVIAGLLREPSKLSADTGPVDARALSFSSTFSRERDLTLVISLSDDEPGTVQAIADATLTLVLKDSSRIVTPLRRQALGRTKDRALRFTLADETAGQSKVGHTQPEIFAPIYVSEWRRGGVTADRVARIILEGVLETRVLHEFVRYPARSSTMPRTNGSEITLQMDLFTRDSAGPYASVRNRELIVAKSASVWPTERWTRGDLGVWFALTDGTSRSVLAMAKENDWTSEGPPNMLGLGVQLTNYQLQPLNWNPSAPAVDSSWLANAYLVAATPRLQHSRRFHAEAQVTPPARQ
jgi:hypothetical protein